MMLTKKKTSFTRKIRRYGIFSILGIGISISVVDLMGSYREFSSRAEEMRTNYLASHKQLIKNEVNRVIDMIHFHKSQVKKLTKEQIKSRVYEAYSIAQNIYQQNRGIRNNTRVQKMIFDALRPIRFVNGTGYYFATRFDGFELFFADKPKMEGLNLLQTQDTHGKYVIKDMIKIAKQKGEGFYNYHWTKPFFKGNDFRKISFIKQVKPHNWFIGAGLYLDDVAKAVKEKLLNEIANIRFGPNKDGYVFVVSYQGVTLMNDTQRNLIGKNIWNLTDPNGVKVIQEERKAVENPNGDFISYSWKKPSLKHVSQKISFIRGVEDWEWMVGAGLYPDDIDSSINQMYLKLIRQVRFKMLSIALSALCIIVFFLFAFNKLSRNLENDFNQFLSYLSKRVKSNKSVKQEYIHFDEIEQIAISSNLIFQDKIKAEKERNDMQKQVFHATKLASIGELAAGVGHEISNPLMIVSGNLERIKKELKAKSYLTEKLEKYFFVQENAISRIASIVNGLRSYARVDSDERSLLNIHHEIDQTLLLIKPMYEKDGITIQCDLIAQPFSVFGNSGKFQQVLMNLLANAKDALEFQEIKKITIKTKNINNQIIISITDTGVGIPDNIIDKIFEPFYTTKDIEKGTGMGLGISSAIIQEFKGKIEVETKVNEGSTFTIYISTIIPIDATS